MKFLIKTTDASSLETVDYTRVVLETSSNKVIIQKPQPTSD